jgi:hypothetical protein
MQRSDPYGEAGGGGCRAAWGRVGCSTTHGADTKNPTLDKIKSHQPCNRNHPTQTTKRGTVSLLQYSEGEAGVAGGWWQGGVVGTGKNKNTWLWWRPPRVKKRAEKQNGGCRADTHKKKPPHPTLPQKSLHPNHTLLQYSEGEAGVAGRVVAGRGSWDRQKQEHVAPSAPPTPTEGQKRAGRVNTISPTCACQAHPPFCTGAAHHGNAHYYSLRQAWYVHGRPWQTKKSGAQAGREELAPLTILAKGWVKAQTCVASNHSLLHTNDCSKLSPRRTPFGGLGGAGGNGGHKVLGAVVVFVCRAWLWP